MSQLVNHNFYRRKFMTPFTFSAIFEPRIKLGETVLIDQVDNDVLVRVITQKQRKYRWFSFAKDRNPPGISLKQRKWDDYNSWEVSWFEKGLVLQLSPKDRAKLAAGAWVIRRSSPTPADSWGD